MSKGVFDCHFQSSPKQGKSKPNYSRKKLMGLGNENMVLVSGHMTKMAAMPIFCEKPKTALFWDQVAWNIVLWPWDHHCLFK